MVCQLTHDGELAGLALRVVDRGLRGVVDQPRWLLRRVYHRVGPKIRDFELLLNLFLPLDFTAINPKLLLTAF